MLFKYVGYLPERKVNLSTYGQSNSSMLNYRGYMKRIQDKIGETKAADRIEQSTWNAMMKELDDISIKCAKELQQETGVMHCKPGHNGKPAYMLNLFESPPERLLALEIVLASWLGWIMYEKGNKVKGAAPQFSAEKCFEMIQTAYKYGVNLSIEGKIP
jgi:hypothetical protein